MNSVVDDVGQNVRAFAERCIFEDPAGLIQVGIGFGDVMTLVWGIVEVVIVFVVDGAFVMAPFVYEGEEVFRTILGLGYGPWSRAGGLDLVVVLEVMGKLVCDDFCQ